ncbi:uncharacterized protein LOC124447740 isoform X2 [Xenia sp. Carnegie-2017]|uniref:uncharacterized protein LOC124447740 isoform X2 n=1 Tax=Xenia sp. Carnegie-2017 TaxID=2897299 RepID=UPI001F03FA0F|nr:uncharacterized protein LOC124447740 isoform X2 [Xenia sp. Carnegie-2017]
MATPLNDDEIRWCVYGIVLNHVLIPAVRPYLEENILNEYNALKQYHNIHVQKIHNFPLSKYSPHDLHYKNINNNETKDKRKFNYEVKSHVDFGKLFLRSDMAKFFNSYNSCDASPVLRLLETMPIFSNLIQNAAKIVRENRNSWGHCNFKEWNETDFQKKIDNVKKLVKELCLATEDEVLNDINHWKDQALTLQTIDRTLCEVLKDHINRLREEVEEMKFENQEYKKLAQDTLDKCIDQLKRRIEKLEDELEKVKDTVEKVKDDVEKVKDDVEKVNDKVDQLHQSKINDFAICDSDIDFHYQKFDPETRKWLIEDFSAWFEKPGESRAFVFMGDAGVGKTVMSAAIAQRAKDDGKLGATFFCRHYDGTRRDPRSLLASVAYQLDSSLILFCTNNKNSRRQTIYVWFVKNKDLKRFLPENYLIEVDTCCSSMNNRIIILCKGTSIWIYNYDKNKASEPTTRSFQLGSKQEKCSHCILSSDDKMLACCVENRIIFYEFLSAPEKASQKASQFEHSCMVKCCYFMGRNKYVLFQDIAGYLCMFDLIQWKFVTYFKADTSVKIFKLTDYKITCIQPNGKINFLVIRGLKDWSGKDYNLPYNLYVSDFAPFTNSDNDDCCIDSEFWQYESSESDNDDYVNYSESSQSESNESDDEMV